MYYKWNKSVNLANRGPKDTQGIAGRVWIMLINSKSKAKYSPKIWHHISSLVKDGRYWPLSFGEIQLWPWSVKHISNEISWMVWLGTSLCKIQIKHLQEIVHLHWSILLALIIMIVILYRLAIEELVNEAKRAKERSQSMGSYGWYVL